MASRRPGPPDGPNSVNTKLGICRKCGVTGFFELLVQCNLCGVSSEHSYCLNKMPKHDETVIWSCEECVPAASLKNLSLEPSGNSEQEEVKQPQENPSSIDDASKTVSPRENSEGEKVKQPQENPSSGDDASKAVSRRENSEGEKVKQPQENLSSGDDASKMVSRNLSLENHNHPYGLPVIDPVWSVQNLLEKSRLQLHIAKNDAAPVVLCGEESATSTFQQLGKAFVELESTTGASEFKVLWKEIEEYFGNLERLLNKGFIDLEEKEKAFVEKKSEIHAMVAEREAVVAAKEQALVDRVQVQKDSAVAAILEAQDKCKHVVAVDFHAAAKEKALVDRVQEAKIIALATIKEAQDKSGKKTVGVHFQPRRELTQFCRQMDAEGLLKYIMENRKNIVALREEIPVALKSATEPARLVLDSLKGFYPTDQTTNVNKKDLAALSCTRKSCIMLMESVAPLLDGADNNPLNPETKQQAKAIADKWKARLNVDAANDTSCLEVRAFLHLLATFRITPDFDEEELCELVLAVARFWQAPDLCRSLGLTHKMPVVVAKLINRSRAIDAVHFVQAFKLTEKFPPVPLLKTYLKDLRRNLHGKLRSARGDFNVQDDANAQELAALKCVIGCVEAHKLQADYPLDPLQQRVAQLENSKAKKKRMGEATVRHQQSKWARTNGGRHHEPQVPSDLQLLPQPVYRDWSLDGCCRKEVSSSH